MSIKGTILLVDDDQDALRLLAMLMERHGHTVLTAQTGVAALKRIETDADHIDTVILDLMMPGDVDGYNVCQFLQNHSEATLEIPVIILSSKSSPQDMTRSFETGAFQHITKPYDIHYLLAVVESMLRMKQIQDQGRATAEKFAAIFDNSPIGALVVNREFEVKQMSRSLREQFPDYYPNNGVKVSEIFYNPPCKEMDPDSPLSLTLADGTIHSAVVPIEYDDAIRWWDMSAAPLTDKENHITGAVLTAIDVTQAREMEEKLRSEHARANAAVQRYREVLNHQDEITNRLIQTQRELKEKTNQLEEANLLLEKLSTTDELTGLPNRRYFNDAFEAEVRRSVRYFHPVTAVMMDIDHFKKVNDTHGHPVGDLVLKRIAKLFIEQLRETDIIGRIGGEEFAVVLPETTSQTAFMIADRLRERVSEEIFDPEGLKLRITISIGIATGFENITTSTLLSQADEALYGAKESGRNRVVIAS